MPPIRRRGANIGRTTRNAQNVQAFRQEVAELQDNISHYFLPNNTKDTKFAKKFVDNLDSLSYYDCDSCSRRELRSSTFTCSKCVKAPIKYTFANNMQPGPVPQELQDLTITEQMLIARVHPVMKVYQVFANGAPGQYRYSGNIINVEQDITTIAKQLPRTPEDLGILLIHRQGVSGLSDFRVRRNSVLNALRYLKANHPYYRDIIIDAAVVDTLPEDGDITNQLPYIHDDGVSSDEVEDSNIAETAVSMQRQERQEEAIANQLVWPEGAGNPINEFKDEGYISMAFPALFPDGRACFVDNTREMKVTYHEWVEHLMRWPDGRFAKDARFRFHCLNTMQRHEALVRSGIFAKKTDFDGNMRELSEEYNRNPAILTKLLSWASKIRGSAPYWYQRRQELQAMINQLGVPTLFLTLSAADLWWPCLIKHFGLSEEDTANLTEKQLSKLMQQKLTENPLIADEYFTKRVNEFMKGVKSRFKVTDHWWRFKYQHRGSPHLHAVLWIEGAPDVRTFDECFDEDILEYKKFYDSLVSAFDPDPTQPPAETHPSRLKATDITLHDPPQYAQAIHRYQRHTNCSAYCLRGQPEKCRFKFPKDLMTESTLAKDEKGVWVYTPKRNDHLLNEHNPLISQVWRANTDCKIICSEHAMINYLAKYASKAEPQSTSYQQMMTDVIDEAHPESSGKQAFSKVLMKIVGQRDVSACEVMHLLLGLSLKDSSRTVTKCYIGTDSYSLINEDTDEEFVPQTLIEHYANRATNLEDMCLKEFAVQYHVVKKELKKCRNERVLQVIPHVTKDVSDTQDEIYYKQRLVLNKTWRQDMESLKTHPTWKESYINANINVWEIASEVAEAVADDDIGTPVRDPEEWHALAGANPANPIPETEIGYRNMDVNHNWFDRHNYYPDVLNNLDFLKNAKLSDISTRVTPLTNVSLNLQQQSILEHLKIQLSNDNQVSKLTIVQGAAGTGKSCLISEMVKTVEETHGTTSVLLMAPTGVAANNIGGCTIHSALRLNHAKSGNVTDLTGESERNFQQDFQSIKVVICDEMSMIGLKTLGMIDQRLRQAYPQNQDKAFGDVIFYLFGDFNQLPPVGDSSLISKPKSNNAAAIRGRVLFREFTKVFELTQVMRQSGPEQQAFRDTLSNVALGQIEDKDYELLKSRFTVNATNKDEFFDAIRIKSKKVECALYNQERLRQNNQPVALIRAVHNNGTASTATRDDAHGLEAELKLSAGSKVMLNYNLWTSKGLCNGSIGQVVDVIYLHSEEASHLNVIPACVLVKFEGYTGPTLADGSVPIVPHTVGFKKGSTSCSRKQFPLNLAFAMTVHKSQGITVGKAVVDIGDSEFGLGLSYVALSRVKTIDGLLLDPSFPVSRLNSINSNNAWTVKRTEMMRLRSLIQN